MGNVIEVLARVEVEDLSNAVETYRALTGEESVRRFSFGAINLAWVGPFLLLSGPAGELERVRRVATVLVRDLRAAVEVVETSGGEVIEKPAPGPNGSRMVARHWDGAVFEYVQPTRT